MIAFKAGLGLCHNCDYSAAALTIYLPLQNKSLFHNKLP